MVLASLRELSQRCQGIPVGEQAPRVKEGLQPHRISNDVHFRYTFPCRKFVQQAITQDLGVAFDRSSFRAVSNGPVRTATSAWGPSRAGEYHVCNGICTHVPANWSSQDFSGQ